MKRAISTDALETLGTIIGEGAGRDAINLAVEPVVAGEKLHAGVDVMLMYDKAYASCSDTDNPVGIVDPFLQDTVQPGQRFWLVLYPRTTLGVDYFKKEAK